MRVEEWVMTENLDSCSQQIPCEVSRKPGTQIKTRLFSAADSFHDKLALLRKRGIPDQIADQGLQGVVAGMQ